MSSPSRYMTQIDEKGMVPALVDEEEEVEVARDEGQARRHQGQQAAELQVCQRAVEAPAHSMKMPLPIILKHPSTVTAANLPSRSGRPMRKGHISSARPIKSYLSLNLKICNIWRTLVWRCPWPAWCRGRGCCSSSPPQRGPHTPDDRSPAPTARLSGLHMTVLSFSSLKILGDERYRGRTEGKQGSCPEEVANALSQLEVPVQEALHALGELARHRFDL